MSDQIKSGLSRRTLAKGAAWATPAVVVASAAPMVSASPIEVPPCVTFTFDADACRRSNEAIYRFGLVITNNCAAGNFTICVDWLGNGSGNPERRLTPVGGSANPLPQCATLAPGQSMTIPVTTWEATSQSNAVNIYGRVNGSQTMLLRSLDAPQKTGACAPGVGSASAEAAAEEKAAPEASATPEAKAETAAPKPTAEAKTTATAEPKATASAEPKATASAKPKATASAKPSASASAKPSATAEPPASATASASATPSPTTEG